MRKLELSTGQVTLQVFRQKKRKKSWLPGCQDCTSSGLRRLLDVPTPREVGNTACNRKSGLQRNRRPSSVHRPPGSWISSLKVIVPLYQRECISKTNESEKKFAQVLSCERVANKHSVHGCRENNGAVIFQELIMQLQGICEGQGLDACVSLKFMLNS